VFGLDDWIAGGAGNPLLFATVIAALLGLRHATDPDHLSAMMTLVAGDSRDGRDAARIGLAWGAGHATTLTAFGLPIVLFAGYLPEQVQRLAEASVGVLIVALAVRLLLRWRRERVHLHRHDHDGRSHAHVHAHAESACHDAHHAARARTPRGAYAIGLLHGMGGSAGVCVLLLASLDNTATALGALAILAGFTAVSMAACSGALGTVLTAAPVRRRLQAAIPAMGACSLAFGVWYAAAAFELASYPF
jgi:ABC-type nickel/cobalt efflux system permease component RcnA